ncbi:MAG: hypothetical protein KAY32_05410 [Candidatus Eisenbacteria sp.]|nr:hypothetical protein [Candidatus Eisenbacteria bacterium]
MAWYDRLLAVDRRWIYLILAVAVVIPAIWTMHIPVSLSSEVENVFERVSGIQDGKIMFLAIDYDPSTMAELSPMAEAILRQVFRQNGRVVLSSLSQFGPAMTDEIMTRIAGEMGKVSGEDYVFLGYKPYPAITILAMGTDFRVPFPTDYYGDRVDDHPMMAGVHNFDDVEFVLSLAGGNAADMWIVYGNAKYGVPLALGVTGVMATDYYPYLQSGQLFGLLPGIKGAAEYEQLNESPGDGLRGIPYQTTSHAVVLVFIVLTNIAFFAKRSAQRKHGMQAGLS